MPRWAARHLADLVSVLPRCRTVNVQGDPNLRSTLTVVARDFTGDGSLLIRDVRSDISNEIQYLAVVRRGDVEARLRLHIGASEADARRIVVRAGQRLCAATPTC